MFSLLVTHCPSVARAIRARIQVTWIDVSLGYLEEAAEYLYEALRLIGRVDQVESNLSADLEQAMVVLINALEKACLSER